MDQLARDDIAAAAAVHSELGRDYDDAVAESLVERIGAEIDKRVDARLGRRDRAPASSFSPDRDRAPAHRASATTLALGSMGMGVLGSAAVLNGGGHAMGNSPGALLLVALIWIVIGIINVTYARRS